VSHLNVDWYVTHEGKPLVTVDDPWRRNMRLVALTPTFARILAADLNKAADESELPNAKQVSDEKAP